MKRRFFINPEQIPEQIKESKIIIAEPDANHMKNVLRLKQQDFVILFDGKGKEFDAVIDKFIPEGVQVSILGKINSSKESRAQITIAQGFLKEKKMDVLIRQLTELGINKWIPFFAERSIAKPDKKRLASRTQRWEKIAQESLKQCRRSCVPEICPSLSYENMLAYSENCDLKLVFWEQTPENQQANQESIFKIPAAQNHKNIFAVIGPEGGLSTKEIELAENKGFTTASLGPRTLKAETASIAATTLLQHFFGDLK
ncbi:Ribosomal RNA small subunit methyltransferase E [Desulfonema limicola]|uniref:Ribosomal RNA small subunit methyltransferase E n=1 Tax=Desulfonema limicola TaxID=45656 RepID=A0A975GJS6_9BACT|nr:16S rRNA (uracil(1498)-N(3))-methyltransferase [Desulfonema limicola]QTA83909.1 Ribosomal RNA small subunit methyltransferase E [Desulfonema limicola]